MFKNVGLKKGRQGTSDRGASGNQYFLASGFPAQNKSFSVFFQPYSPLCKLSVIVCPASPAKYLM
jgi:hypothetical protein